MAFTEVDAFFAIAAGPGDPECLRWELTEERDNIVTRRESWEVAISFATAESGLWLEGYTGSNTQGGGFGGGGSGTDQLVFQDRSGDRIRFFQGSLYLNESACAEALSEGEPALQAAYMRSALATTAQQETAEIARVIGRRRLFALVGARCVPQRLTFTSAHNIRWTQPSAHNMSEREFVLRFDSDDNIWHIDFPTLSEEEPVPWAPFAHDRCLLQVYSTGRYGLCGAELFSDLSVCQQIARHRLPVLELDGDSSP